MEALAEIPIERIRAGIMQVPIVYPIWPPTLGEFLALCKPLVVPAAHRPLLPSPRDDRSIDPRVLAKIKATLAKARKRDPKAWAREILDEAARGEYRYAYGIECAKEALGLRRKEA